MFKEIFSKDNPLIKTIRALQTKAGRKKHDMFFIEGTRIVEEAISYLQDNIHSIIISTSFNETYPDKVKEYTKAFDCYLVPDSLFNEISDTETPQGVLAVIKKEHTKISDFSFDESRIVILDCVCDPGNIGTIIRTAEAMGFNSIFLTKGCTDIYSPKVLRSTMGSVFRTNIYEGLTTEDINLIKQKEYTLASTALQENSVFLEDAPSPHKLAIVIGNEANGVSDEILSISDLILKIPMHGKTESLNAAVAAAIVMYHFS